MVIFTKIPIFYNMRKNWRIFFFDKVSSNNQLQTAGVEGLFFLKAQILARCRLQNKKTTDKNQSLVEINLVEVAGVEGRANGSSSRGCLLA